MTENILRRAAGDSSWEVVLAFADKQLPTNFQKTVLSRPMAIAQRRDSYEEDC
jgi:hypothetical protein